ncbi:GmrSD restriction endonuclease domain-containing protein [Helicobacter bizzozeronii]|uniref:GmrSD restriction endonuclease domain-containing protein n=1 Tax=Helicobacter bizzozeronii TaxID=56877 RepID=UPI000CF0A5B2|nr:DUF262 domain-containing protein [Helicobacter bizzozeronii]
MKPMTFLGFLEAFTHIEVPMLQRDYAQGRRSQSDVAGNFLEALFQVVEGKKPALHLDLIYGYQDQGSDIFKLVDGQQRITTLWLLYFFLFRQTEGLDSIKAQLAKFTYHTRESSKEFCEKLLSRASSFATDQKPSKTILTQGGKFGDKEDLKNDPTIKAMICTLDRIYQRLRAMEDKDYLKSVACLKHRLEQISFSVINMGTLGLGEELYIKLNARGKLLSKFENLKAYMEQKTQIPHDLLHAIDNKWSDYFFDATQPTTFDPRFFYFLHYANAFFTLGKGTAEKIATVLSPKRAIDHLYKPLCQEENLRLLDRVIDVLPAWSNLHALNPIFTDPSFFKDTFNEDLEKKDICYFFALLFVLKKHPQVQPDQNLQDYFRVVRHLVENDVNIQGDDIPKFFNLFNFLSNAFESAHLEGGVYEFLRKHPQRFERDTYQLEVRKAKLIVESREAKGGEDWEGVLQETSEHRYLVGYVGFLLDFSIENGQENFAKFKAYTKLTREILDIFFCNTHDLSVLQRAWLCFGDYSIEDKNQFFGNRHQVGVFRYRNPVFKLFAHQSYFHKLLDTLLATPQADLIEKLCSIVTDYTSQRERLAKRSWWEQCLLQDATLFEYINACQGKKCGRIKIEGERLYLLRVEDKRSEYVDLLGYAFYQYCAREGLEVEGYEGGQFEERQFVIKDFAVFAEAKSIKLTHLVEENATPLEPIPLHLKNTDILEEFKRAAAQIQQAIAQKTHPQTQKV